MEKSPNPRVKKLIENKEVQLVAIGLNKVPKVLKRLCANRSHELLVLHSSPQHTKAMNLMKVHMLEA